MDIRTAEALWQQRRMKQTIQFSHKDSADLLPLDGLKKLGTSKQGQPHNILQRRLLETTSSQNRLNNRSMKPPRNHTVQNHSIHTDTQEAETDLIQVICQCFGRDMMVTIDTGCTLNLKSSVSVDKLGFNAKIISNKTEDHLGSLLHNLQTIGHMKLSLVIGQTETDLLFTVVVLLTLKSRCLFLEILYESKSILLENMKIKSPWNKKNQQISPFLSHEQMYWQRKLD